MCQICAAGCGPMRTLRPTPISTRTGGPEVHSFLEGSVKKGGKGGTRQAQYSTEEDQASLPIRRAERGVRHFLPEKSVHTIKLHYSTVFTINFEANPKLDFRLLPFVIDVIVLATDLETRCNRYDVMGTCFMAGHVSGSRNDLTELKFETNGLTATFFLLRDSSSRYVEDLDRVSFVPSE